jgi:plastocyanin
LTRLAVSILVVLACAAAGCGGSSSGSTGAKGADSPAPHSGTVKVAMETLAFVPDQVHGGVGQTVTWTNKDNVRHNVIYVSGPRFRNSRPQIRNGSSFSIKLTQPGTIHYFCSIHPWMKGTIVVSK